ncbi:MAG: NYN domain-containing protein [Verrucomicrobia bacterium]|nr:NYN domain-containing protein [Verrucomicrobiota bacterium]
MPLVRILVDGYSLLHAWPDLAPGRPRHSAAARDELIAALTRYRDSVATPVTVFFDGAGAPAGTGAPHSSPEMEVLYSRDGKTADDLIERAAHRFRDYGEVLVVTDDSAERDTVINLGASAMSCDVFIRTMENALAEFQSELQHFNRKERTAFKQRR